MTLKLPEGVGLRRFEDIDSTSDEARRLAAAGVSGPVWIMARRQSAGRGRRGRSWVSEFGNLHATLLLNPGQPAASAGQFSFLAAVALSEAIEAVLPAHRRACLKWPNDVLVEGRKVAGILLESQGLPNGSLAWLSIGIGVNLNAAPRDTETPAACLSDFGASCEAEPMLEELAASFEGAHRLYREQGFGPIRDLWLRRAAGLGLPVEVRLHDRILSGIFAALDETGALILDQDGKRLSIAAGEVFLRA